MPWNTLESKQTYPMPPWLVGLIFTISSFYFRHLIPLASWGVICLILAIIIAFLLQVLYSKINIIIIYNNPQFAQHFYNPFEFEEDREFNL